jgi:hypothetical protein
VDPTPASFVEILVGLVFHVPVVTLVCVSQGVVDGLPRRALIRELLGKLRTSLRGDRDALLRATRRGKRPDGHI